MRLVALFSLVLALLLTPDLALAQGSACGSGSGSCRTLVGNLNDALAPTPTVAPRSPDPNAFVVSRGQVTFDSEGTEGGKYHSRKLHWPGGASGVTIGRGYDMKYRTATEIQEDLVAAGVPADVAKQLAAGAKKSYLGARKFVRNNASLEISPEAQKALFETVYAEYQEMAKDLVCGWSGNAKNCDAFWGGLDPAIQDMLTDLRYRGDLTSKKYDAVLSNSVEANDLQGMANVMADRKNWRSVPDDRFERRSAFMNTAARNSVTTHR